MAWHTAMFAAMAEQGKLPPLARILERSGGNGRQSFADMKAQLFALSQKTGFPVREVTRG